MTTFYNHFSSGVICFCFMYMNMLKYICLCVICFKRWWSLLQETILIAVILREGIQHHYTWQVIKRVNNCFSYLDEDMLLMYFGIYIHLDFCSQVFNLWPFVPLAGYNHLEVAEFLLEKGADVNAQDKGGLIPLHNASSYGVELSMSFQFRLSMKLIWIIILSSML